ncbi:zonadhesin-like isoform X2 [Penaeus chinensis]|uniref:zonadhesin-like isoform X2 n=1 Tax=Penaeus chinensis TaxID=139456 RepID=UPI001FB69A04|nr:zonadhesin-like isoform X2 [Penaeus chinensis]
MSNLKCLTTIILFGLCVTPSVTKFGQICQKKADCVYGTVNIEDCRDGFCNCTSKSRLHFDEHSLAPDCSPTLYLKTRYCKSSSEKCPPNSKCLDKVGCRCDDEYVFLGTDCRKVLYQKVMEPCHIQNGSVYVCDYKEHSFCGEKKCVCFDAFLPNITSGRCEPEGDFLDASNLTKTIIGQKCSTKYDCASRILISENCTDGFCACSRTARLRYEEYSLAPECSSLLDLKTRYCKRSPEKCPPNSMCSSREGCRCNDGYEFVGSNCIKAVYQKVMEPCYIRNGLAYVCDHKQHSFCGEKKCVCFDAFLPNITSGRCEPEADFLRASNLEKYIVLHGEYCKSKSHCIEGLECSKYACSCPSPCIYKKGMEVCDCGASGSTGPLIVGILGGLLIIAFWSWTIRNTWRRHTKKQAYQDDAPAPPSVQRSTASYPLAPVTSSVPAAPLLSQEEEHTGVTPDETDFGKIPAESYPLAPPAQPLGFQSPANSQYPSSQGFPSNAYNDAYLPNVSGDPSAPLCPPILPPPYSATTYNPPYAPSSSPPPYPADMPSHPPPSMPPPYPSSSSSAPYPLNL